MNVKIEQHFDNILETVQSRLVSEQVLCPLKNHMNELLDQPVSETTVSRIIKARNTHYVKKGK